MGHSLCCVAWSLSVLTSRSRKISRNKMFFHAYQWVCMYRVPGPAVPQTLLLFVPWWHWVWALFSVTHESHPGNVTNHSDKPQFGQVNQTCSGSGVGWLFFYTHTALRSPGPGTFWVFNTHFVKRAAVKPWESNVAEPIPKSPLQPAAICLDACGHCGTQSP